MLFLVLFTKHLRLCSIAVLKVLPVYLDFATAASKVQFWAFETSERDFHLGDLRQLM